MMRLALWIAFVGHPKVIESFMPWANAKTFQTNFLSEWEKSFTICIQMEQVQTRQEQKVPFRTAI